MGVVDGVGGGIFFGGGRIFVSAMVVGFFFGGGEIFVSVGWWNFFSVEGWNVEGGILFSEIEGWDFCFTGVVRFLFQWRVEFFFDDRQVLTCQKTKKK